MELNLCELLGIDVEGIAKRIAMGLDDEEEEADMNRKTAASLNDPCYSDSMSPFKDGSLKDLKAQEGDNLIVNKRERSHSSNDLLKDKIVQSTSNSTQES